MDQDKGLDVSYIVRISGFPVDKDDGHLYRMLSQENLVAGLHLVSVQRFGDNKSTGTASLFYDSEVAP